MDNLKTGDFFSISKNLDNGIKNSETYIFLYKLSNDIYVALDINFLKDKNKNSNVSYIKKDTLLDNCINLDINYGKELVNLIYRDNEIKEEQEI